MKRYYRLIISGLAILSIILIFEVYVSGQAASVLLLNRTDQLSDSSPGATATHLISFQITDLTDLLGSIRFQFCSNSPLVADPCTAPSGFDASSASLASQSGNTGFTISPASNTNTIILTRLPALPIPDISNPSVSSSTYQFDSVINPTVTGTFYVRVQTFPTNNASGPENQEGGIALAIVPGVTVTAEVPKMLFFCTALVFQGHDCGSGQGNYINFGNLNQNATSDSSSQFITAGNPTNGFSVSVSGTTLTSGNYTIASLSAPTASVTGVSQFGINLRANSIPAVGLDNFGSGIATPTANYNIPNRYTYNPNDIIVTSVGASNYQTFTVSYIVNVSSGQTPGVYVTTLTYICLANF